MRAHKWFVMIPTITVNMAHVSQSLCLSVRVRLLFPSDFLQQMDQTQRRQWCRICVQTLNKLLHCEMFILL